MPKIQRLTAREILDSRGRPTVSATCTLESGVSASASVPSGASTGRAEARELRDGDPDRYRGLGCRKAAQSVNLDLNAALAGVGLPDAIEAAQSQLDQAMIALDSTPDKSRLGANAILAVSVAFARTNALDQRMPLYGYFAQLVRREPDYLPRLTVNLFSGGKHAGGQVPIQDVLLIPQSAASIDSALAATYEVYQTAAELILRRYGMRLLRADEGGLAPPCKTAAEMIALAVESIEEAGFVPGKDIALGVDVAASHFYRDERYELGKQPLDSRAMIDRLGNWLQDYPIISVEDGLAEDDWQHWPGLRSAIGDKALVVGDDLLCTNPDRIRRAVETGACNALLLKVNQVGTLTEAARALEMARAAGWAVSLSVRSGETEDDWAADLAVGWGADQFKNGSITQSERLAKYNRLLFIEEQNRWAVRAWPRTSKRA
ncbi:MAG TPA: enolase [Terriglobia bacterium]|nr:enolase [Terriglobia bacterium]